jgi:hypothetical protein
MSVGELLSTATSIIGSVGVVASVLLLTWQTRQLTKQTHAASRISALNATHASFSLLQQCEDWFVSDPELRPYFWENADLPTDPRMRARILALATLYADSLSHGLMVSELADGTEKYEGWRSFATFLLRNSPAVRTVIGEHPEWWPVLQSEIRKITPEIYENRSQIPHMRSPSEGTRASV